MINGSPEYKFNGDIGSAVKGRCWADINIGDVISALHPFLQEALEVFYRQVRQYDETAALVDWWIADSKPFSFGLPPQLKDLPDLLKTVKQTWGQEDIKVSNLPGSQRSATVLLSRDFGRSYTQQEVGYIADDEIFIPKSQDRQFGLGSLECAVLMAGAVNDAIQHLCQRDPIGDTELKLPA